MPPKTRILEKHPHPRYPRLVIDRRTNSRFYQARTFLDGRLRQKSTGSHHLPTALKLAEDWYKRELRASVSFGKQHPIQRLATDPTMAELFSLYAAQLQTEKRQAEARKRWGPIADFWRALTISSVTIQTFKEFYSWRRRRDKVKNHTLHKDVVTIRQVLKYAMDNELLSAMPRIPAVGTIETNPRPWLTHQELAHLLKTAEERIEKAPNARVAGQRADAYELVLFLMSSMMRIGEVRTLHFHDCRVELNADGDKMLLCEVTGKRGTRTVVANLTAVEVYEARLKMQVAMTEDLEEGESLDDLIFQSHSRDAFRELLEAAGLRQNAQGFQRNLKSLRSTAISNKLLQDPDLNLAVIARNAGTSINMIDTFYAKRLTPEMFKDRLSALPLHLSARGKKLRQEEARRGARHAKKKHRASNAQ